MPTVSLTPQQQSQVDAANAAVTAAQNSYNKNKNISDAAYAQIKKMYADFVGDCDYSSQPSFEDQIGGYGDLNPESCKYKQGCNRDACKTRVIAWNAHYKAWRSKEQTTNSSFQVLQSAKKSLNDVLDAIAKDPTVAANAGIIKDEIEAEKSKANIKWIFFGLAAVAIVIGAIFVGRKLLGGTSASA